MSRVTIALVATIGVLAGALGYSVLQKPAPTGPDATQVQAMITEALVDYDTKRNTETPFLPSAPKLDAAQLEPMIESYLLKDPKILQRVAAALETTLRDEDRERSLTAISSMTDTIFNSPDDVVVGNPDGDVTLVEFFDYNCGYCRNAVPDMAQLIAEDPNLRVVFKEFPILSAESVDAARVAILVGKEGVDYWSFHEALYSSRSKVDKTFALAAAKELGLNPITLELDMGSAAVSQTIQKNHDLAKALGISGTPSYVIGTEIIPGAIGMEGLKERIANMRKCGESECNS
jgi:protein-disulfide isomerase